MKFAIKRADPMFSEKNKLPVPNAKLIGKDRLGDNLYAVEINTLEDLISLKIKVGHSLILEWADEDVCDLDNDIKHSILIYDDYIE